MQKTIFCLVLAGASLLGVSARSQFVSPNVSLNNLITERVYTFGQSNPTGTSADTNAPPAVPFIIDSDAALEFDYTYTRQWFQSPVLISTPGGSTVLSPEMVTKINSYNVMPSLFFDIRSNLLVTAGFGYLHQETSAGTPQSFDNYTPFVCADEELLHFLPRFDTSRNSLFLGGNFSYTRSIGNRIVYFIGPGGLVDNDDDHFGYNTYSIGPSLIYVRSLADWSDGTPGRAAFTLNPTYSYNDVQGFFTPQRTGVVTMLGRVDYGLTRNLYLNASATWLHRTYLNTAVADNDWAIFGGGLTARVLSQSNHLVLFRLAYNYEAFVKGLESHEVSAQLEVHF